MSSAPSLLRLISSVAAMRLSGIGLQMLWFVLLVRLLPVEAVGVYSVVNGWWVLMRALGAQGMDTTLIREAGPLLEEGKTAQARGLLDAAVRRAVGGYALLAAVALPLLWWWLHGQVSVLVLVAGVVGGGAYLLCALYSSALLAKEKQLAAHLPESILLPLSMIASASALKLLDLVTLEQVILVQFTIAFVMGLAYFRLMQRYYGRESVAPSAQESRAFQQRARHVWGTLACNNLNVRLPVLLAPIVVGVAASAWLETATRFASLLGVMQWCAAFVIMPKIPKAHSKQDMVQLQHLLVAGCWLVFVPSFALFAILGLAGTWLLTLVAGVEYVAAYAPMVVLAFGFLVNASSGATMHYYMMTGHERWVLRLSIAEMALVPALMVALGWLYGAVGLAAAVSIGMVLRNVWLNVHLYRKVGVYSGVWSWRGWRDALHLARQRVRAG